MLLKEERRVRKHYRNIIYIYFNSKEHPSGGKEILGSECNVFCFMEFMKEIINDVSTKADYIKL
jgi:hypothetical protein